ncbi:AP2/ERF family transcription factor [Bacillus toyonensis]|uniref:AP2/ERF family transcription factor n=1 Tax=Bacillus toyonensis TaxID=155322 RepID=UPI003D6525DF
MVKEIPLQDGSIALVDDEDYERINQFNWVIRWMNNSSVSIISAAIDSESIQLNRFILNIKNNEIPIKFLNNNRLDFRKENLVLTNRKSISRSTKARRGSTSKYKGVSYEKQTKKWIAKISVNGKDKNLGRYLNEDDAAKAYNEAAICFYGEDCYLNIIGEDNRVGTIETESFKKSIRRKGCSGFKGVSFNDGLWRSRIWINGKDIIIGYFLTKEEAAKVYDQKAYGIHGAKAVLNFPEDYQLNEVGLRE